MKKWYQSKTIWGIAIAFIGFILNHLLQVDVTLPANADYETLLAHYEAIKNSQSNTMVLVSELMSMIGTLIAIWGRFKAEEKLTK
jgi:hypothetical protein